MLHPAHVWPEATAGSRMAPAASTIARLSRIGYFFEQQPQQVTPGGVGSPQQAQQLVLAGSVRMDVLLASVVHLQPGLKVKGVVHSSHAHR